MKTLLRPYQRRIGLFSSSFSLCLFIFLSVCPSLRQCLGFSACWSASFSFSLCFSPFLGLHSKVMDVFVILVAASVARCFPTPLSLSFVSIVYSSFLLFLQPLNSSGDSCFFTSRYCSTRLVSWCKQDNTYVAVPVKRENNVTALYFLFVSGRFMQRENINTSHRPFVIIPFKVT